MGKTKVLITIDHDTLNSIDAIVGRGNRSQWIEDALKTYLKGKVRTKR
jgi:metal-responsive CopG/Arc/MetJ family transcriptional regulator